MRTLGMRIPIFNGPMTPQAGGALAGAVVDAGGLGMLGMDEDEPVAQIREQIAIVRSRAAPAFGIGFVIWVLERRPELIALAIESQPKIVTISFGDPSPYVDAFHNAGILVASQVQNRKWAQVAIDAGVDILIAQGTEAGGHTGSIGTLPLLQIVLSMTDKPVIAAGGIATGRGVAAVLAAGAQAAWIGTPFLLASESRSTPQAQERISAADETQTIHTAVFDRVQAKPWPAEFKGRALRNPFAQKWDKREDDLMCDAPEIERFQTAKAARDYTTAHIYAGQSVGLIQDRRPAKEIIHDLVSEATLCLENVSTLLQ